MRRLDDGHRSFALRAAVCIMLLAASPITAQKKSGSASWQGYPRVMQGPMVGAVTETTVKIWVRTNGEYPVSVEYGTSFELSSSRETAPVTATKSGDYTVVVDIEGLEESSKYFYRVKVDGALSKYLKSFPAFSFTTAPAAERRQSFRVAFGGGVRLMDDRLQPIWPAIAALEPDLFLWTGDNVYGDSLDPDILREEYRRLRDTAGLQTMLHNISHLAIWDDHDYGLNNHDSRNPIKAEALEIFEQYWANPAYGLSDTPGIFFAYSYGPVDFFFLDGRYYRDPNQDPDTPEKTMLGERQLAWLTAALAESKASFRVLVSGGGWSTEKGSGGDSWASFLDERNRLFDFIRDHEIPGVVLISGDTHYGEVNVIPWSDKGGYDFYDLVSSPLAQTTAASWLPRRPERRVRPVYFHGSNVGVIDFFFDGEPRLIFRLIDTAGRNAFEPLELHAAELVNGTKSWPDKVDDTERRRQEAFDAGEGYYEKLTEE